MGNGQNAEQIFLKALGQADKNGSGKLSIEELKAVLGPKNLNIELTSGRLDKTVAMLGGDSHNIDYRKLARLLQLKSVDASNQKEYNPFCDNVQSGVRSAMGNLSLNRGERKFGSPRSSVQSSRREQMFSS